MKMVIYGILIASAMLVPTRPLELGKLKPVETILIEKRDDGILIKTDTGDIGRGRTVNQAIWNLHETTAGTVYLDTAEYLLLPSDETVLKQMYPYLRKTVRISQWAGEVELEEAAKYLDVHKPNVQLKAYQEGISLQVLEEENGRFRLREKNIERREKRT